MITGRTNFAVSMIVCAVAWITGLTACAGGPRPATSSAAAVSDMPAQFVGSIRFDNEGEQSVDVYLVTGERQWRLARVAPGARATLRIPAGAFSPDMGFMRLAVLAGAPVTAQAASDPHATLTIAQPVSALLSQRWTFRQSPSETPQLLSTRASPPVYR